ncbi:uracil-DNA glycosylase [Chitinibacter sp. ZOR0017]|uniref:uracil-DNA glycosylase n=1 Tax=Chitinibacter sp. ZOR0017 TaxID=1339254 RepID=UPI0006481CE3|nr:uracil-DNA glycosylase [Chitinibacter sp. ZOR0017]
MNLFSLLPSAWQLALPELANDAKFAALGDFLAQEMASQVVYPPVAQWFSALETLAPSAVKVVILGQDPYHGTGEAHGLAFSVPHGVKVPPSLRNIWQELARDLGLTPPQHGNLTGWAAQGVLLLNTALTVRADCAGSHSKQGWDVLTNAIIRYLARQRQQLVFVLWGSHAHKRAALIDASQHCVLQSVHPSPLSAYRGFLGCGHFSQANRYLLETGQTPIDWAQA